MVLADCYIVAGGQINSGSGWTPWVELAIPQDGILLQTVRLHVTRESYEKLREMFDRRGDGHAAPRVRIELHEGGVCDG